MPTKCLIFLVAMLSGCAELPVDSEPALVTVVPLAKPAGPARRIVQQITAQWAGGNAVMLAVLELDAHHIALAGMSAEGVSLFSLNYDGQRIVTDKNPLLTKALAPEWVISDLQLAYWPGSAISALLPAGWRLVVADKSRILYHGKEKQREVTYLTVNSDWPEVLLLENFQHHYRLQINTVSYEHLSE